MSGIKYQPPVLTEKSVGIVGVEVELRWNYIPGAMRELIFSLLYSLSCGLRTRTRPPVRRRSPGGRFSTITFHS
jgi:hypothetical protein